MAGSSGSPIFNSAVPRRASSRRSTAPISSPRFSLPPGATLARNRPGSCAKQPICLLTRPGIDHAVGVRGLRWRGTFTNAPNAGVIFVTLKPFEERAKAGLATADILKRIARAQMQTLREAFVLVIPPPSVPGNRQPGAASSSMCRDRAGRGPRALEQAVGSHPGARPTGRPVWSRCSRCSTR